ncbi:MAG: restriction endonuclease subunit S [Lactobacillus sp.]|nr:restriction endonuclease subunit S [Lactobacillus sp.]
MTFTFSDQTLTNISGDIPFDIPETWCWSRLSSICIKEIKRGKAPKYQEKSSTLVFAQKCNLKKGGIDYSLAKYLDNSVLPKYDVSEYIRIGDTVINSTGTGTLGRVGFIESLPEHPIVPDSHVTTIRTTEIMEPYYVYLVLKSLQSYLEKRGEGSTNQKELKPMTIQSILIPNPPLNEQKCICSRLQHCKAMIKTIEDSLS